MSKLLLSYGKCCDVRAIISVHLQNQVPGLASWASIKRTAALCGFFVRGVCTSMVGYAGASQDAPGSLIDRLRQPFVVHHPRLASKVVFLTQSGARS